MLIQALHDKGPMTTDASPADLLQDIWSGAAKIPEQVPEMVVPPATVPAEPTSNAAN